MPVLLGDAGVVLERVVRCGERIFQLVALEEVVVAPRLMARPMLRIDGAPDRPDGPLLAFDPDHDRLFGARVVDAVDHSLGEAALRRFPPHKARIQSSQCSASRACCAPRSPFCSPGRAPRSELPPT